MALKKAKKLGWGARRSSLFSLLNGLASKKDEDFVRLRSFINRGKVTDNLRPYTKNAVAPDGRSYDTLWLEGPYGAFAVVKTKLPIDKRRIFQKIYQSPRIQLENACGILFSPYPELLHKAVYGDPSSSDYPSDDMISQHIDVHAAYLEKELTTHSADQQAENFVDFSWVQSTVQEHLTYNDARLKAHGMLFKEGENLYRSGSSLIWFEEDKKNKGKFNAYYYGNPEQGEDMLYYDEAMMRGGRAPRWLRYASQKLNSVPVAWHDRQQFVRDKFFDIAKDSMRNCDPYDQLKPKGFWRKTGFTIKQFTLRTVQKMAKDGAMVDTRSMGISMLGTAALYAVLVVYKLALSLAIRGFEMLVKGGTSLFKSASRYAMPPKMGVYRYLDDYSHLMAVSENKKPFAKKAIGRSVDGIFVRKSEVIPIDMMGGLYPNAREYTREGEEQRSEAMLLDTTRYPVGTIVSEKMVQARKYLKIEQPDGIVIHRDTEQQIAYAQLSGAPLANTYVDDSVRDLFDQLKDGEDILAIKFSRKDGVSASGFSSLETAIASSFVPDQAVTVEEVKRDVADIETKGAHQSITVDEILMRNHNTTVMHSMLGTLRSVFAAKAENILKPKAKIHVPSTYTESPTARDIRSMKMKTNYLMSMR